MATVSFDFNSFKKRLIERLQSKNEWANFLDFSTIDCLIDPICQELAYAMQYSEYLTYENFWSLARNKSSLLVQSPMHGYEVPRKMGAIGTLRVSTSKDMMARYVRNSDIPIPKFFQFSGNSIYVVSSKDYTLASSVPYIDIECKQGEFKNVTFSAEGNIYEEKLIEDGSVDNDFFELYVNGNLWKKVETLFEYNGTDLVYEIETKPDLSGIILKFGNNIFGKKLDLNDKVVFKYISTLGEEGNVFSSNIINKVESQAFDLDGKPVKLYVTNITSIAGGKNYPTIDEIRTLSPRVYQTGDRASSLDDYRTKISMFSYISKLNVWGAYEHLKDKGLDPWTFIPSEENVVHVALLDKAYNNLTDIEKEQVVEDLHKKNDPTDLIKFETVEKIPLVFNINGVLQNSSFTIVQVKANIEKALRDNYSIEKIDFGKNIYDSDFTRLIDEVDGVRNHNSYIDIKKDNIKFTEAYVGGFRLPVYPIDYQSVRLYIKDNSEENAEYKQFAYCDINGNIIGLEGYNTNGSSLTLVTGAGSIVILEGLSGRYQDYTIQIIYQTQTSDLFLKERYEIFYYDDSNISLSYPTI